MFDSKVSNYDIMDASPFKRDIIKELSEACKKQGMPLGLYYSQAQDWNAPGGAAFGGHWDSAQDGDMDKYLDEKAVPQVSEILNNYGDIKILWWDTPINMTPERAAKFMPELAKHPNLIYNNRLGGGFAGDLETPEQFIPATGIPGKNWESCMTMNDTWGFKKNDQNWKSSEVLVRNLIDIASKGGNYLLNVGPTQMGLFPDASVERLKEIGTWMKVNGEAIYGTQASPFKQLDWGRCTLKKVDDKTLIYLHVFDFPEDGILKVPGLTSEVNAAYSLKSPEKKLQLENTGNYMNIHLSGVEKDRFATVIVLETKDVVVNNSPEIIAEYSIFTDQAEFKITSDIPNVIIRYTTDGSIPTNESTKAEGINTVSAPASFVIKAVCFKDGKAISGLTEKSLTREEPVAADAIQKTKTGLQYSYFEGKWDRLPDFATLKPIDKGIVKTVDLTMKKRDTDYGMVFKGFLNVPETGVYQFLLSSNDGSKMIVSGKTLDNDGLHVMEEKTMDIALAKGLHPVEVQFMQAGGDDGLKLEWKTKGKDRAAIDQSLWVY